MATCKVCDYSFEDSALKDGICEKCLAKASSPNGTNNSKFEIVQNEVSEAVGYLYVFSWIILILSFLAGGYIFLELKQLGLIYSVALVFQGIFLASLGFSVVYIAKTISKLRE